MLALKMQATENSAIFNRMEDKLVDMHHNRLKPSLLTLQLFKPVFSLYCVKILITIAPGHDLSVMIRYDLFNLVRSKDDAINTHSVITPVSHFPFTAK